MEEPAGQVTAVSNVDLPRFPSISPDGSWIVFSWRGDLWKAASTGGSAERLTTHPRDDLHSTWSRDGTRVAFESNRNGYQNIYIMNADGTDVRQVTDIDTTCGLNGFGVDEDGREVVTFSAYLEGDNYRSPRPYMISTGGGEIHRVHDAFGSHAIIDAAGTRAAFTRGGARWSRRHYRGADQRDVWMYHRDGGSFKKLTRWEGNDGKAKWVGPEGLLYLSDRNLNTVNLYRMDAERGDGNNAQLTSFENNDIHDFDVSADGTKVVLTAWDTLYMLDLTKRDPTPMPLQISANEDEADNYQIKSINRTVREAALSPDGKVMAYVAYGEVYVRNIEDKSPSVRVTHGHAREKNIVWSPDGLKLYFTSDSDGTESIYAATVSLTRGEVKEDFDKAVEPPEEEEEEEDKPAEPDEDEQDEPGEDDTAGDEGDKEGEESEDEEEKDAEKEDEKAKEDKKEDELPKELKPERWRDALKFNIEPVVQTEHNDRDPDPSPDGKSLAFRRSRGDLMILDIESNEIRTLVTAWDPGMRWRWSPNSKHVAYSRNNRNFNTDIWIIPANGEGEAVNVTRHPDNDVSPRWSADGKILSFVSERVNEEYDVWMVYLDKDLEVLTPKELEKYYKDAVAAAKKRKPLKVEKPKKDEDDDKDDPKKDDDDKDGDDKDNGDDQGESKEVDEQDNDKEDEEGKDKDEKDKDEEDKDEKEPPFTDEDLQDAYLRLRRVTTWDGSEFNNEITPGGDRYIFTGKYGDSGLYSIKWDGKERKKLTGSASVQHVSLTGDKVVFVTGGRAGTVGPAGGKVEYVDISDKIRIDLQEQSSQKFLDAARTLGEQFYHPTMKGLDWPALTTKYHALARQTRTAGEFNNVAARFIGELNASHLGIYARGPSTSNAESMGRLGTVHHRVDDGFEITEVIPQGPASKGPMALKVGDVITAIELEPFSPTDTVELRLRGRTGVETIVTIRRTMDDGESKDLNILITPISSGAQRQLKYNAWRQATARQVDEWSEGRIGYIHIQGMGQGSLDVFERDLYAAADGKEGLIVDVRNNGGGWTTDRLLSSIMVVPHAYTVPRGLDPDITDGYPQDRLFIQRYSLPINLLCNEKSFSNAEIISHAFKTLKRGTLVGQETYGAVISTGGTGLIDGTFVRLPSRGWYLLDGTDMENHGARPHIVVDQTPEAESRNDDEQLKAAVEDLLKRL